jgi:hypothetical protein
MTVPTRAQGLREKMDAEMMALTREEVPAGFQYIPSTGVNERWQIGEYWMASPRDPKRPISPQNQARENLIIDIYVGTDAADANKMLGRFFQFQIPPTRGTYSGAKIGDFSVRGSTDGKYGAVLGIVRGNVMIKVLLSSDRNLRSNCAAEVERLARLMVARADAAMKLAEAPQKSLKVADKSITGQEVKDAGTVAPVSDVAKALGAKVETNKTGSRVTLTAKDKKVELVVGRSEAVINGKKSTLKFPSLQAEKGKVMCLVEPIVTALGAKVNT